VAQRADLPDKLYFRIGEVAKLTSIKQHVLRYWESEFSFIRPQKSKTNQRLYRRKDVEAILAIKHLLYDRKFTIEGARRHLKEEGVGQSLPPPDPDVVAAAARNEAIEQMGEEVVKARGKMIDLYEEKLLGLRGELLKFITDLDELDDADGAQEKE
jgi:DNA-binding transcriptional MerR regulator